MMRVFDVLLGRLYLGRLMIRGHFGNLGSFWLLIDLFCQFVDLPNFWSTYLRPPNLNSCIQGIFRDIKLLNAIKVREEKKSASVILPPWLKQGVNARQSVVSEEVAFDTEQSWPPFCGAGFVQVRFLEAIQKWIRKCWWLMASGYFFNTSFYDLNRMVCSTQAFHVQSTVNKSQQHEDEKSWNPENQTRCCWLISANATSVLCHPKWVITLRPELNCSHFPSVLLEVHLNIYQYRIIRCQISVTHWSSTMVVYQT